MDLSARSQLFVPSVTQGDGVMYNSVASAATSASATMTFTSTAVQTFKALQPGDSGNAISVTYLNPQAVLFIPSATGGDGLTFTATSSYSGPAGNLITVAMAAPNANSTQTLVTVSGTNINIFPKSGETNTGVISAVTANPGALQLVGTPVATGGSDLVTGNNGAAPLGGGYVPSGASSATAAITGSPTTGWAITVQFGASCTSTSAVAAINAVAGPTGSQPVLQTVTTTNGSDVVNPLGTTFLSGGFDPTDLQVQYTGPLSTGVAVQAVLDGSGDLATLTVGSTANFPSVGTIDVLSSTGAVQTLAYTGTTSTTFTTLSGGTAGATLLAGALVQADAPIAVLAGDLLTVYLGYTAANNTNSALSVAANEVSSSLLTAVPVNSSTDLNTIDPNGLLAWGATGQVPQQNLECLNIVRFIADAIDSAANGAL